MLRLNIFNYYGKQVWIKVNKLNMWGESNGINLEYDFMRPRGGTKVHYLQLGSFKQGDKYSCKYQVQEEIKPILWKKNFQCKY